jgi:hypothetical protein
MKLLTLTSALSLLALPALGFQYAIFSDSACKNHIGGDATLSLDNGKAGKIYAPADNVKGIQFKLDGDLTNLQSVDRSVTLKMSSCPPDTTSM